MTLSTLLPGLPTELTAGENNRNKDKEEEGQRHRGEVEEKEEKENIIQGETCMSYEGKRNPNQV